MIQYDDLDAEAKEQPIFFLQKLREEIVTEEHIAHRAITQLKRKHYAELNAAMFEAQALLRSEDTRWAAQSELHKEIIWSYLCTQYHEFMKLSESHSETGFPQIADRSHKTAEAMFNAARALGFRTKEEKEKDAFLHGISVITAAWTSEET